MSEPVNSAQGAQKAQPHIRGHGNPERPPDPRGTAAQQGHRRHYAPNSTAHKHLEEQEPQTMASIQHNGRTYDESELLPAGERVAAWAIEDGLMREIPVYLDGKVRHLPLITEAGMAELRQEHGAEHESASAEDQSHDALILTDDKGAPLGVVDMNAIQEQATRLMYELATAGDNTRAHNRITNAHLAEAGTQMFGYVAAAALRSMTENILEPALQVCEAAGVDVRGFLANQAAELSTPGSGIATPEGDTK